MHGSNPPSLTKLSGEDEPGCRRCLYPPEIFQGRAPSPPLWGRASLGLLSGPFCLQFQVLVYLLGDGSPSRAGVLVTHFEALLSVLLPQSLAWAAHMALSLLCCEVEGGGGTQEGGAAWGKNTSLGFFTCA